MIFLFVVCTPIEHEIITSSNSTIQLVNKSRFDLRQYTWKGQPRPDKTHHYSYPMIRLYSTAHTHSDPLDS